MKNLYLLLLIFSYCSLSAQTVYSDNFDLGINSTTSPNSYTTSLVAGGLNIIGNGAATAYAAIVYKVHNNNIPTIINLATNSKLYIKAKASTVANLRIDLQDSSGYNTNLTASSINLTTTYSIYELDFTGKFKDGGYGGSPCTTTTAPCAVDNANIKTLIFFINAASGKYNGTVDIDWISFGQPLEVLPVSKHKIRYNQVGYFKDRDKIISLNAIAPFTGIDYTITDTNANIVAEGTSIGSTNWSDANEYVANVDITQINTPGVYTFKTSEDQITFTVDNSTYEDLANQSFKYYYFNRASTEITPTYGGIWSRPTGIPDTSIKIHASAASGNRPIGTIISAPKGWYDAGDYNKYIVNSGISTYTLLAAFEHYKTYYEAKNFNIPESSNNMPDMLDEIKWNLDWMLSMQDKTNGGGDGGVYHKLTELNFSGLIMPATYNAQRYVVQKTTAAALDFAAVNAVASRVFASYNTQNPGYSAALLVAAKEAYAWAKNNPTVYYAQPSDVFTGQYEDNNVTDEFQWAAIELFITTGDDQYKNNINIVAMSNDVPGWQNVSTLGLISIEHHASTLGTQIDVTAANNKLKAIANAIKTELNTSAMKIGMKTTDFNWGSNGTAANQILLLIRAYELTSDATYLTAAYKASDYLLGRNGVGKCFVTGFGVDSVLRPHHRISESDNIILPVPGMLAGGPHSQTPDGCSYPSTNPASSYLDDWCSYSTNEVTINWNAPLVYISNALQYYQNNVQQLFTPEVLLPNDKLVIYPNPSEKEFFIDRNEVFSGTISIDFYDISGKLIHHANLEKTSNKIDVSVLSKGIYFVKIKSDNSEITRKVIVK